MPAEAQSVQSQPGRSRVARYAELGSIDAVSIVPGPVPEPGPGQVRVRVAAVGLNPVDWKLIEVPGFAANFGLGEPLGVGGDFAGVIDAVGADTPTAFAAGDRVFGNKFAAAAADYLIVDPTKLHAIPAGLDDAHAAALSGPSLAARAAIDQLELGADDVVLIGGAAGGVGTFAVQFAVATGATVIGTASEANHAYLRELGAIPVSYGPGLIDRIAALDLTVTAAADLNGTEVVLAAAELGVLPTRVTAIAAFDPSLPAILTGSADASPTAAVETAAAVASGAVTFPIAASYPLAEVAAALAKVREGHGRGKVVLTLD